MSRLKHPTLETMVATIFYYKMIISKFEVTIQVLPNLSLPQENYTNDLDIFFKIKDKAKLYICLSKHKMIFI